jgi:FkbM family methyltransferase
MKDIVQRLFRLAGFRVTRWRPSSRYQAMDETLSLLRSLGYSPKLVIDAGAGVGDWTRLCRAVFPDAEYHLIEPQAGCVADLRRSSLELRSGRIHPVALAEPGVKRVRMAGGGADGKCTGNHVVAPDSAEADAVDVDAATLDELLADRVRPDDRVLLKLDLEGREVDALRGASQLLEAVEVVIAEVQFFEIGRNGLPIFADVLLFLRQMGFEVFDFACLSQRPRDMRLRMGDVVFVRRGTPLLSEYLWE